MPPANWTMNRHRHIDPSHIYYPPEQAGISAMDLSSKRDAADKPKPSADRVKTINLALQGGGAHGAFTWGVLDRLLDEKNWPSRG